MFQNEPDPFAILSTFAYIFCGLKINDIKMMVILSDKSGTRTASREYIRQKIVSTFLKIQRQYVEKYGDTSLSPRFRPRNLDPAEITVMREDRIIELLEEDEDKEDYLDGNEDQEETQTEVSTVEEGDEEWLSLQDSKEVGRTNTTCSEERDNHVNRSGYSAAWLVHLKGKLHKWWDTPKN